MDLETLSLVDMAPSESRIDTMFEEVTASVETISLEKLEKEREKIQKQEDNQDLQAPPKDIPIPEKIALTSDQVVEVMYDFFSLPRLWISSDSAQISLALDRIKTKLEGRLFSENVIEEAMKDLQVAIFGLMFGIDFETASEILPVYKAINIANDYVVSKADMLNEDAITLDDVLNDLLEISPSSEIEEKLGTDNIAEYIKLVIYRLLLERIGDVNLPTTRSEDVETAVSLKLLMRLIPIESLIEIGILNRGNEPRSDESLAYATKYEKARVIGHRATDISMNAKIMTDPEDLTDAMAIAEKEWREMKIPLKVCRKFPDGSERIWCASSLATAADEFYQTIKDDLDLASIRDLFLLGIERGYGSKIKQLLIDVLKSFGKDPVKDLGELRPLSESRQALFVDQVAELLTMSGVSNTDMHEPLDILKLLMPLIKTILGLQRVLVLDFGANFFDMFENVKWVNIPGNAQTDPKDVPRKLFPEEIDDILNKVPQIASALPGHSFEARESLVKKMRGTLMELKICPSSIPELVQLIIVEFNKSKIHPGTAVGINAADALGEQVSQMTLNTFHSAGSNKNMSSGIRALSELIYAMKTRKNPNCTIVFKERLTFEEILDKEAEIVETTVADLVVDWLVDFPDKLEDHWWHKYFDVPPLDKKIKVLRLILNPIVMVERKVNIKDVVTALQRGQGKDGIPSRSMTFAHGPTAEGILDIYPNPEIIKSPVSDIEREIKKGTLEQTSYREEYSIDVFIDNIILPNLENIRIRGVPKIKDIYPIKAKVLMVISKEEMLNLNDINAFGLDPEKVYWKIYYNINLLSYSPIKPKYLLEFLEAVGYEVVVDRRDFGVVRYAEPEEGSSTVDETTAKEKPSDIAKRKTKAAKEAKKRATEKDPLTDLQKRILDLEDYMLLTTNGSSLIGLMEKAEIDSYYTYCNDIHYVALSLGVEAARQFFIKELYDTFTSQGGYVNPRNILLLADFLFRHGSFLGTNYTGMSAGTMGYFSLATFERSLQTLEKGAVFSETETLEGVSAAIAVGNPIVIGTGFFNIISDPVTKTLKEIEAEEKEKDDLVDQINAAFAEGSCGFSLGDEIDMAMQSDSFLDGLAPVDPGAKTSFKPPTKTVIEEYVSEDAMCPTEDVAQGPSELLQEAVEDVQLGPEGQDLATEELKVRVTEIPSDIQQEPLGVKPFPEKGSLPPALTEELEDLEDEEEPPLVETVRFTRIPVIKRDVEEEVIVEEGSSRPRGPSFEKLTNTIEKGQVGTFKELFFSATDWVKQTLRDYEPDEDDEVDGEVDWDQIPFHKLSLVTYAVEYRRPEILRFLLLEQNDFGIIYVEPYLKNILKRRHKKEDVIMSNMIALYWEWVNYMGENEEIANKVKVDLETISLEEAEKINMKTYKRNNKKAYKKQLEVLEK